MEVDYPLLGKILRKKHQPNVFFRCESLNLAGKCEGPAVLNTRNMSKQYITDKALDLISKYGAQESLTELLDNLNASDKKAGCCT